MPTNQQRRDAAKRKLERQLVRRQERLRNRKQRTIIASVIVGLVVVAGVIWFVTKKPSVGDTAASGSDTAASTTETTPTTPCTYPATTDKPVKAVVAPDNTNPLKTGTVAATITLGQGAVPITLDRSLAPCAVNAFISLAAQKFYDSTSCHRLTADDDFQILQCGDPSGTGRGGPGYSYDGETNPPVVEDSAGTDTPSTEPTDSAGANATADPSTGSTAATDSTETAPTTPDQYPAGTIAMATTASGGANGSQFFIVYGDSNLGSSGYTKIGTVSAEGLAIIDQLAAKGTVAGKNPNGALDAPAEPVDIESITVQDDAVAATEPVAETSDTGDAGLPDVTTADVTDTGTAGTSSTAADPTGADTATTTQ